MLLLEGLTDDQIAVIGCVLALGLAFATTAITGALRTAANSNQRGQAAPRPALPAATATRKAA